MGCRSPSDGWCCCQVMQGEAPVRKSLTIGYTTSSSMVLDLMPSIRSDRCERHHASQRNLECYWWINGQGDYHNIHNNTVFNSTGKNDIIFLTDGGINNKNSTLHNNAVDAMTIALTISSLIRYLTVAIGATGTVMSKGTTVCLRLEINTLAP